MSATGGPSGTADEGGLVRLGQILRTRWWVVLLSAIVCVVIAGVLTVHATKQYTAVSKVNFEQNQLIGEVGGTSTVSANPEADAATNLEVLTTTQVARGVIAKLKLTGYTPSSLLGEVSTASDNASNIVDITVVDSDPGRAARIADAFANVYVAQSKQQNLAQLQAGERQLQSQLNALPATTANADTRANLLQSLQKLQTLASVQTGNASVTDYATVPGTPSSPKTKTNIAVALIFGILLGIGIAVLLNFLDRRLKQVEDFEELYGARALATVPLLGQGGRAQAMSTAAASEQYMILRASLSVLRPRHEPRVVLVTSAVQGEGKTTVAIGLARAAAAFGQKVVLVEADVRRPRISLRMELEGISPGLTPALMQNIPLRRLLGASVADAPRMRVITSGPQPHNPVALLGGKEMGELLEQLAGHADLVVIDAPPLLPIADTDALLDQPQIDAFLVVGRIGQTTRDQVRAARRRLARRDLSRMGLVINGVEHLAGGDAYYGASMTLETDGAQQPPSLGLATATNGDESARRRVRRS